MRGEWEQEVYEMMRENRLREIGEERKKIGEEYKIVRSKVKKVWKRRSRENGKR